MNGGSLGIAVMNPRILGYTDYSTVTPNEPEWKRVWELIDRL
jgi:hypothetical protein